MKQIYTSLLVLLIVMLHLTAFGQHDTCFRTIDSDIFMKGTYVEVGIGKLGSHGTNGCNPLGSWFHGNGSGCAFCSETTYALGFVADPAEDGWDTGTPIYIGDYFMPGDPQEGWSVQEGAHTRADGFYPACGSFSGTALTGNTVSAYKSGTTLTAVWQGTAYGELAITQTYTLDTNALFFVNTVTMKNIDTTTVSDIYYMRTLDPDNEEPWTGSFVTTNTIEHQSYDTTHTVLVSATGTSYPTLSYLGLVTRYVNAKCMIFDYATVVADGLDDLYDESAIDVGFYAVGDTYTDDVGIGLVFKVGNLAAGDSATFSYAYIMKPGLLDSALGGADTTAETTTRTNSLRGTGYSLSDPQPNPAHGSVIVAYSLPTGAKGNLVVCNTSGQTVMTLPVSSFATSLKVNVSSLTPGVYFYTLYADGYPPVTRKMVVE
jgi:Secretion system C-terminal sorting domain